MSLFRKRKHDKLQKAVDNIKSLLQESPKKSPAASQVKPEPFFHDIYDSLISPEPLPKEELLAAIDVLFIASGSSKSSLQIQADQTLNKTFRLFWLKGQAQKVITLILNELNQSQDRTWKSVAVAFNKLVYYVQFSRASKNESYALYYINAVAIAIKRPEDGIQTTLSKTFATTLKHLGPFINEKVEDKVLELFENAVKNLELSGTAGRVASLVLAELCIYNKKVLEKCVRVINKIITEKNENGNKRIIVNVLATLKLLWATIIKNISRFSTLVIQAMVLKVLKMLLSSSNEIIVAALETLEVLFATHCNALSFVPSELPATSGPGSEYGSPMRTPRRFSKGALVEQMSQMDLMDSPWGSVNDISMEYPSYQAQNETSTTTVDIQSNSDRFNDSRSDIPESSQLFDPLINATQTSDTISLLDSTLDEPESNVENFWYEAQTCSFPILSAAIITRRFLLANKRPGYDDNSRISHKFMAFKCLISIFDTNPWVSTHIGEIAAHPKIWNEIFDFISHSDEKLATAAFEFYTVYQKALQFTGQSMEFSKLCSYLHVMLSGVNSMKIKRTLEALKNTVNFLILDDHVCALILEYCNSLQWCSYFLVQCSLVELLSKVLWKKVPPACVMQYQDKCLQTIIQLLNHEDQRVRQAAATAFSEFINNAVFGESHMFSEHNYDFLNYSTLVNINDALKQKKQPSIQLQQNICHGLEVLADQCLKANIQAADNLMAYVYGLEALISNYNLAGLIKSWFSTQSLANFGTSFILNLLEASASNITAEHLVTILSVLSSLMEEKEVDNGQIPEATSTSPDPKGKLEMRVVLVYLRIINLYYTIYVENKVKQSGPTTNALFMPDSPSKQNETRTTDISYLVGTGVYQMKGANYNDSPVLKTFESTVQGSYKNFMETLDVDTQNRFLAPLVTALNGLEKILPKFSFQDVNIFLDELLLYINRLLPFAVAPATGVLSELLKVLFGRNIAVPTTSELVHSKASPVNSTLSNKDLISKSFEDLAYSIAKLASPGYIEEAVLNHFSIIYCRTQTKQGRISFEVVAEVLRRFEKASAYLVSHAFFSNDNQTRCKIVDFLCILLLEGVEYKMADPKKKIYDFVLAALNNPTPDVLPVLPNLLNFMVVLSMVDPTFVKPFELEKAAVTVCSKLSDEWLRYGFPCLGLVLLYNISLNAKSITLIQKQLVDNFQDWMFAQPVKTLQLWSLLLCCSKKDKNKSLYDEISSVFIDQYFVFHKHPANATTDWTTEATIWATNALFSCSPTTFTPIDQLYHFLKDMDEENEDKICLGSIPVLAYISKLEEQRLLLKLETLVEDPLSSFCRSLGKFWIQLVMDFSQGKHPSSVAAEDYQEHLILMSKLLLIFLKSQGRIGAKLKEYLLTSFEISAIKGREAAFSDALPYIIFVLTEAGPSNISTALMINSKLPFDITNLIYHLVVDVLKSTAFKEIFDEKVLLELIKVTKLGEWLLRNPQISPKLFKKALPLCSQQILKDQASYLLRFSMDPLIPILIENLELCERYDVRLSDDLEALWNNIKPHSSYKQAIMVKTFLTGEKFISPMPCQDGSLISYFAQTAAEAKSLTEIKELAAPSLLLSSNDFITLLTHIPLNYHEPFIKECLKHLHNLACEAVGIWHISANRDQVNRVQKIVNTLIAVTQSSRLIHGTFTLHLILFDICKLGATSPFIFHTSGFKNLEDYFVTHFVEPLIEYAINSKMLPEIYFKALTSFFSLEIVMEAFTPDYDCLELLGPFLALLVKSIEKYLGKQESTSLAKNWNIQVSTISKSEIYKEDIVDLFTSIQKISLLVQMEEFITFSSSVDIENALKAICRLPLLSAMFVIPEIALRQSWNLKIDARSDRIFVPLVNIYILENPAVLRDFSFRTLWLGWINRCQFENYCTSLFGVLSTTPVGSELQAAVSEENLYRSINAVSIAVETITNLLIQSLLYPEPGNPILSVYPTKQRESLDHKPFLESKRGRQASVAKCQLFNQLSPSKAFIETFEKTTSPEVYGIGQSSLLYLWSIAGVLEHGDGKVSEDKSAMTPSVSDYMLKQSTDLDTNSTLRALLDNFDHWFAKSQMPMSLKTAVVKSLIILTDLFDDTKNYQKVFYQMHSHLSSISTADTIFDGLTIFLLLKCTAVLGTDSIENETAATVNKFVDVTVTLGLQSENIVVRQYTLQGMLYLLQSYLLDDLPGSLATVKELVLKELLKLSLTSDVVTTGDFIPLKYEQVLWSTAFRLLEEAVSLDDTIKTNFLTLVSKLYADPRLSSFQKRLLTSGIESLIIHSSTYTEKLLPTILDCLSTCQLQPLHIRSTVSSYVVSVYKDLFSHENGKTEKSKIVDFNRLINLIAAFSSQPIARDLANIVSYILNCTTSLTSLIENITMLITVPGHKPNAPPPLLQAFDLAVLQIFSRSLIACSRQSHLTFVDLLLKQITPRLAMVADDDYAAFLATLILISGVQKEDAALWASAILSAFSYRRPLKPLIAQLPSLLEQFVTMTSERKSITTIDAALELFSLKTEDGQTFKKIEERVKHFI